MTTAGDHNVGLIGRVEWFTGAETLNIVTITEFWTDLDGMKMDRILSWIVLGM